MMPDPVVEEVRAAREALGRRFGFDLEAIARAARERALAAGRVPVSRPPRPVPEYHTLTAGEDRSRRGS